MTHVCCPHCRLRFTPPAAARLAVCPECGKPPQTIASLELTFGFRIFRLEDLPHSLPEAVAVSIPVFEPAPTPTGRS
jgi:hypothetical protein